MQEVWIKQSGSDRVILFALGWAGSDELISHLETVDADLVCLYDYRTMEPSERLITRLASYRERHLVAWSFGVWAATELFADRIEWHSATAIGGTPRPVDPDFGIPPRSFALTVRGIEAAGTLRFLQRMCGSELAAYMSHRSTRPMDEITQELRILGELSATRHTERLPWSHAIVGAEDQIFPPAAMAAYWQQSNTPCTIIEGLPHYPIHQIHTITATLPGGPLFKTPTQ